ncbi:MAG: AAA family ATPase [Halobacteriaceae archaeon]
MTDANTNPGAATQSADPGADAMTIEEARSLAASLIENVETVIVGNHDAIEHLVTAALAGGHVILDDVPGVGKTMLARSVARSVDGTFKRVQFTPDLLPTDVTGVNVFNQQTREFEFQPGPVFGNVVLADEINRAPPKTQSALLEAMEEGQVTVDGDTRSVPDPFVVIATQNAVERDRTFELPVAELDRFMKRLHLGYPSEEEESEVLRRVVGGHPIDSVEAVTTVDELVRARRATASVTVAEPVREYVTRLATYTREHAALGASPRATILLLGAAQARAVLDGRDYVVPDDIQTEAPAVFPHRIRADHGGAIGDEDAEEVVRTALSRVDPE